MKKIIIPITLIIAIVGMTFVAYAQVQSHPESEVMFSFLTGHTHDGTDSAVLSGNQNLTGNMNITGSYYGDGSQLTGLGGGVPAGVIVMWSGAFNDIPSGWTLCDGTGGTPDLRNSFIYGVNSSYGAGNDADINTTGGSVDHVHSVDPPATATGTPSLLKDGYDDTNADQLPDRDHTHTVDISAFDSAVNSTLPPYLKLAFICKT